MKRFLSVLIASMFLASAAVAAEKMGDEKKAADTKVEEKKTDAKDAKAKSKGDTKKMAAKETAKGESETKGEGKDHQRRGKRAKPSRASTELAEESGPPHFPLPLRTIPSNKFPRHPLVFTRSIGFAGNFRSASNYSIFFMAGGEESKTILANSAR